MNLKRTIKDKINTGKINSFKYFINITENFSYVSFDLFDTLIKRNVKYPSQVFKLMEKELGEEYPNFANKRIQAEIKTRENSKCQEITLKEIYSNYDNLNENEIKKLINYEINYELNLITLNYPIFYVYKELIRKGKKILIITDTYLSVETIKKILKTNGIDGYKSLYVSSEVSKTKKNGDLYKYVLNQEKISSSDLIHIGDSLKSDYYNPKKINIKAIHIKRILKNSKYTLKNQNNRIEIDCLNSLVNNNSSMNLDYYYRFGFENFGLFIFGYVKWLYKKLKENNIESIYFFSRDGLIMKKAFDIYNKNDKIKSYYLEVSRRSLRVPILWINFSMSNLIKSIPQSKSLSIRAFFSSVGLDAEKYHEEIRKSALTIDSYIDINKIEGNKKFIELFNYIKNDIIDMSKKEYSLLEKYLKEKNVEGKFAVCDIGWTGGMQRFLELALDNMKIPHEVYGYYIGIEKRYTNNTQLNPNLQMQGYLFDFKNNKNDIDKHQSFVGLFETLFLEQNGSVKNYAYDNNKKTMIANRYPYEYIKNGKPTFEYEYVKKIQNGALDINKLINKSKLIAEFSYTSDELFEELKKIGEKPTLMDLKKFGDFKFYDDNSENYLAKPKSLFYYIIHVKKMKNDFLNCRWKIGFLKRLFKIKLPYKKIFTFLRKYK